MTTPLSNAIVSAVRRVTIWVSTGTRVNGAAAYIAWVRRLDRLSCATLRQKVSVPSGSGCARIASYAVMCDEEYWEHFGEPPLSEYGEALRARH